MDAENKAHTSKIAKKRKSCFDEKKNEKKQLKIERKLKRLERFHGSCANDPEKKKLLEYLATKPREQLPKIKSLSPFWKDEEYLANTEDLSVQIARNIITLFKQNNTIPFIARYREDLTGGLTAEKLRKCKATYDYIISVHTKAGQLAAKASGKGLSSEFQVLIHSATTLDELNFIGSSFIEKKKRLSKVENAKASGLDKTALIILQGGSVNCNELVNPTVPELQSAKLVKNNIAIFIADFISKSSEIQKYLNNIYLPKPIYVKSKFKKFDPDHLTLSKYQLYGDFAQALHKLKPHQILAIYRGEAEKELTVNIEISHFNWLKLRNSCESKWLKQTCNEETKRLFRDSLTYAIKNLFQPLVVRRIRAKLKLVAEKEAIDVFGMNLRQLLMTSPCRGQVIMGIDPGFRYGCKVAVISHIGEVLDHGNFFLSNKNEAVPKLKHLILKYSCEVIALGNGTGCRETEAFLTELIEMGIFRPLNVSYSIVSEQGLSIYSCSDVAAEEFPNWDPKIVGAISLARRLQNPLSELVKIEPKHLGVGMYQHDVKEKHLTSTLDEIVSECVSFVGVDINTASFHLLRRVAGLTPAKAKEIIHYRTEICSFKCREDITKVKGISTVTFQQCAGFIRVSPYTARCLRHTDCPHEFNPLDETCIHPESYDISKDIINRCGLHLMELGTKNFTDTIRMEAQSMDIEELSKTYGCSVLVLKFIIDALLKPKNFDLRIQCNGPIFKQGITKLESLFPQQILEGVIRNVVTFGAFVDIGVGCNGLIHSSQMGNFPVQLNDRVSVEVLTITPNPQRINLKLLSVINSV